MPEILQSNCYIIYLFIYLFLFILFIYLFIYFFFGQTKLHDTICEKRNAATIATHDLASLSPGNIVYAAYPPSEIKICPLGRTNHVTGSELFARLQQEADELRKEKKRNVYSGVHK